MLGSKINENSDLNVISDRIRENNVQRKLVELDIAKRILKLENQQENMQDTIGAVNDLKSLKDVITNATQIKTKLREIEDLKFLERLEVVETQETIDGLESSHKEMNEKVNLITEAIKNLKDLKLPQGQIASQTNAITKDIQPKLERIERQLNEIEIRKIDKKDTEYLKEQMQSTKKQIDALTSETDKLISTIKIGLDTQTERITQSVEKADSINALKVQAESWVKFTGTQRKVNEKFDNVLEIINNRMKKKDEETEKSLLFVNELNKTLKKYKLENIASALENVSLVDKKIDAKFEECLKPAIDEELKDVIAIVDTILQEVKEIENKTDINREKEIARISKMILNTHKENVKKTGAFKADISSLISRVCDIEKVHDKEYPTHEKFNELAEKHAALETTTKNDLLLEKDFDSYRKEFEEKISLLEKAILEKEVQKTQDNEADVEAIINLRIQEVSKNAFGKINQDLKPLVVRINELTDDVDQMKDLRSDMVDDINNLMSTQNHNSQKDVEILKTHVSSLLANKEPINPKELTTLVSELNVFKKKYDSIEQKEANAIKDTTDQIKNEINTKMEQNTTAIKSELETLKSNGVAQRISTMEKHLEGIDHNGTMQKMAQLENEISLMKRNGGVSKLISPEKSQQDIPIEIEQELNNKMSSIENENTLLRQEIEKIKEAYFQMVQFQQHTPLIIE
ncbi:MAG: hypothetical protein KAI53_01270 [Candidatus Aenigmarchaeota archaeon]|nr:hypothetical protein [Candidatus Aenigmarchaeota archaeon]